MLEINLYFNPLISKIIITFVRLKTITRIDSKSLSHLLSVLLINLLTYMLRKIRITLAIIFFVCITALLLDFSGTLHAYLGWMARIQLLPAVLSLNVGVMILLAALTLAAGRIYCSVICPLGVMQDIFSHISAWRKKGKNRFSYSPTRNWWRYTFFLLFIAAMICGIGSFVALLAPYSSYGRIVSSLLEPLYRLANNLAAYIAERADSYAFYHVDVWIKSIPVLLIAIISLVTLFVLSWRNGRTYCNTVCPVGTLLGFLSRYSLFSIRIDKTKCNSCGLCSRKCKSSCIDSATHSVDSSRCVSCMDCIDACRRGAISFGLRGTSTPHSAPAPVDTTRRNLLTAGTVIAVGAMMHAQKKKIDGGLAIITDKKLPHRHTRIVPPGAVSLEHLASHCTGCQLCVNACREGVLRPSSSLTTLMQPESSYEHGYCRPECTECSQVCPAGAILPIDKSEKASTQIGHAVWIKENCVAITDGVSCGNCSRHCPSGAITMVPLDASDPTSPMVPAVNEQRCIGCGACENLCPARPFAAIYVEGHERHHTI